MNIKEKMENISEAMNVAETLKGYAKLYEALKLKDGVGTFLPTPRDSPVFKVLDESLIAFLKKTMRGNDL